jgi:hypothetical protein
MPSRLRPQPSDCDAEGPQASLDSILFTRFLLVGVGVEVLVAVEVLVEVAVLVAVEVLVPVAVDVLI